MEAGHAKRREERGGTAALPRRHRRPLGDWTPLIRDPSDLLRLLLTGAALLVAWDVYGFGNRRRLTLETAG